MREIILLPYKTAPTSLTEIELLRKTYTFLIIYPFNSQRLSTSALTFTISQGEPASWKR